MNSKTSFFVFLVVALCVVAYQFPMTFDVTANKINSLSQTNRAILSNLHKPLTVDFFSPNRNVVTHVQTIISLFQKENANIVLNVHHEPLDNLDKTQLRLQTNNHIILNYVGKKKAFDINPIHWNQETFGNHIQQMIRTKDDWVVFLSGHNERDPFSETNRDLSQLTAELKKTGMNIASLNLGEIGHIPDNTKMLVIADPTATLLPVETNQILDFIKKGGNLLWLANPAQTMHTTTGLEKLAEYLGLTWQSGTILDQKSHAMGTPDPAISLLTKYPKHPVTEQLNMLTVFPWARPIQYEAASTLGWQVTPILITNGSATLALKQGTKEGPFTIGIALEKDNQRIVAIGNAQFLSNTSIHNYGNILLADNLFNWLTDADFLLNTTAKPLVDLSFTQSAFTETTTQFIFPLCLPLIYLIIGWRTKSVRQKRYQNTEKVSKLIY